MSPRSRTGVTFTEVAIVLVIILVVAAVLFPVFQKIHDPNGHRHSSCTSNMNQLGLALAQYMQDADEVLPAGSNAAGNGWAEEIYPFARSTGMYRCPNDTQEGKYISYAENQNLVKRSVNSLADRYRTVALYEFTTLNCDPSTSETNSATGLIAPQDSTRHNGGMVPFGLNFLAADGPVRYLSPHQVSGGPHAVSAKTLPQGAYVETFAIK